MDPLIDSFKALTIDDTPRVVAETKNINELPDELLIAIFILLSSTDLAQVSLVCKRWKDLTNEKILAKLFELDTSLIEVSDELLSDGKHASVIRAMYFIHPVALKVFHVPLQNRIAYLQALQDSREEMALNHKNLCKFYGVFTETTDDRMQLFMATEFVTGAMTLEGLLDKSPDIPISDRLFLALQIADGIQYLHNQPTPRVHGNITLSNIRIAPAWNKELRRQTPIPKLCNGGFLRLRGVLSEAEAKKGDTAVDINSFGKVLSRLLAEPSGLHGDFKTLYESMCAEDPAKRPTIDAVRSQIIELLFNDCIPDTAGRAFWLENCKDLTVSWNHFAKAFYTLYDRKLPAKISGTLRDDDMQKIRNLEMMRLLFVDNPLQSMDEQFVRFVRFGAILSCIGGLPNPKDTSRSIFDICRSFCEKPWFHGHCERDNALRLLVNSFLLIRQPLFLVTSSKQRHFELFYILSINSISQWKIQTVQTENGVKYSIKIAQDRLFDSLDELITYLQYEGHICKTPCPDSQFTPIFVKNRANVGEQITSLIRTKKMTQENAVNRDDEVEVDLEQLGQVLMQALAGPGHVHVHVQGQGRGQGQGPANGAQQNQPRRVVFGRGRGNNPPPPPQYVPQIDLTQEAAQEEEDSSSSEEANVDENAGFKFDPDWDGAFDFSSKKKE